MMTKIAFAAGAVLLALSGAGLITVPTWVLALAGGGIGTGLLRRRGVTPDNEVSC